MIQINLLPDVKREFLKSQQSKHIFIVGAVALSVVCIAITILLFAYVQIFQPQYRKSVQNDIDKGVTEIKNQENGSKIVTVQAALKSLPGLQDSKLVSSRALTYLSQLSPNGVRYDDVQIDFATNTISFRGTAPDNKTTNQLADNLKKAQLAFTQNTEKLTIAPFSAIVFSTIARSQQSTTGNLSSFEVTMTFDPIMFSQQITEQTLSVGTGEPTPSTKQPEFNVPEQGAN